MNLTDLTDLVEQNGSALEQIIDLLPAPIYIKDIQGRLINCNQAYASLWNKDPSDLIGKSLVDLSEHPIALDLHQRDMTLLKSQGCRIDEVDVTDLVEKYSILHFHGCATRDENGSSTGIVGIVFDITARADLERKLEALSQIDELTQIPNRRHGMSRLESLVSHSQRHDFQFAMLVLDIDHFKSVNDCYGHKAGDEVLIRFAGLLADMARNSDTVFRYGGEEFIVLLPNTDSAGGLTLAERFRVATQELAFDIGAKEPVKITTSIGAAFFPSQASTAEAIFDAADKALYRAKDSGRNRVVSAE